MVAFIKDPPFVIVYNFVFVLAIGLIALILASFSLFFYHIS